MTLIAYVFAKLRTAKNVVRQMSKKPRFRTPIGSHKVSKILVKSTWQHFYNTCSSLWEIWSLKKFLLVVYQIVGHFANTLTANDKYFFRNSQNLPQPNKRKLFKKQKKFSEFFGPFLKSTSNFKHLKKDDSHRLYIYEITDCETRG